MHSNSRSVGLLKTYDARTKLYIMLAYLLMFFIGWKLIPVLIFVLTGAAIIYISRLKPAILWDMSKSAVLVEILLSLILLMVVKPLLVLLVIIKLVMITFVYNSVMYCMKHVDVIDGLIGGFRLKINATRRLYSILEYFPEVYTQKKRVRSALKARGVDPDTGNIVSRFIKEILLAVPNHKNAYIELDNRNKAMDMRGFTSVRRRKRIYEMKFEVVDDIVLVLAIIMLLGTIFTQVYFK
jgi:energy-coupling factor transporter transmembrane protein EcfT